MLSHSYCEYNYFCHSNTKYISLLNNSTMEQNDKKEIKYNKACHRGIV